MAMLEDGNTPLISARNVNNGLKGFVNTPKNIVAGNCITLNNDGDGGAGLAYYQPADMALDTHVTALVPKSKMSMFMMLFISECLSKLHGFFGHGLSISNSRAEKIRIMLPVTDNGQPDYQFMEDYVRELMSVKRQQYRQYVEKRLESLGLDVANRGGYSDELKSRKWKTFRLEDIFECTKGVYLPTDSVRDGDIPYITAKAGNNGVNGFIGNGILFSGNKVTVEKIRLNAYYQSIAFYCSHDVSVIYNERLNEYNAQFIANIIMRNGTKYSYGRQAQLNVVKREAIMLPVTDDGQPDYDFMEEFGRKMMANKYNQYLAFLAMSDTIKA